MKLLLLFFYSCCIAHAAGELVLSFTAPPEIPSALCASSDGGFIACVQGAIRKYNANGEPADGFSSVLETNSFLIPGLIVPDGAGNYFIGSWAIYKGTLYSVLKLGPQGQLVSEFLPVAATRVSQTSAGAIAVICPDRLGGCYVGGTFAELNGVSAAGLAHIDQLGVITEILRPQGRASESPSFLAALDAGLLVVQESDAYIIRPNGNVVELELPPRGQWRQIRGGAADPRFGVALSVEYSNQGLLEEQIYVWDFGGKLKKSFAQNVVFGFAPLRAMQWDEQGRLLGLSARIASETGGITDDGNLWGPKRLLPDGTLDPEWSRTLGFNLVQSTACILSSGDVLVAGNFSSVAGHQLSNLVKLAGNRSPSERGQMSARGRISAAQDTLILGLVVSGTDRTVDVLVRAMSGSMSRFGVPKVLSGTRFSVFAGSRQVAEIAPNTPTGNAQFIGSRVGAFPASGGQQEAQALLSLAPGIYSVVIRGPEGETGEVLGEIYYP